MSDADDTLKSFGRAAAQSAAHVAELPSCYEIKNARQITMKNGRPATEGTCSVCRTKMFKIGARN
jgi:hypothetical protein